MSPIKSPSKGILLATISGLLYGLLGYFGMSLMATGLSVSTMSFWRFFSSFLLMLVLAFFTKEKSGSLKQQISIIFIGGIFYTAPGLLYFMASPLIGTGQAMVIFFIFPAFVMILNWIFLKQPIKGRYLWSFLVIIIGLVLLVDLGELSFDLLGISLSLLAALFYAIYLFLSAQSKLPPIYSTLMVSFGCTLAALFFSLADHSFVVPSSASTWLYVAGIGVLCSAVPILLMLRAMVHIGSDKASLLTVLEPVFTVIFGVVLLGEIINFSNIVGILLILVGAMSISIR